MWADALTFILFCSSSHTLQWEELKYFLCISVFCQLLSCCTSYIQTLFILYIDKWRYESNRRPVWNTSWHKSCSQTVLFALNPSEVSLLSLQVCVTVKTRRSAAVGESGNTHLVWNSRDEMRRRVTYSSAALRPHLLHAKHTSPTAM